MNTPEVVGKILKHYGVKGMRWGVRRERTTDSGPSRRERRAEKKFESRASSIDTKIKLNNSVHEAMTAHIERINAKYDAKYKKEIDDGVLLNRDHPITKAYHKEYNDAALKELDKEASKITNASGTKRYKVARNPDDFLGFTVITVDVKHADESNSIRFVYVKDNKGRIIDVKLDDSLAQSAIDNILTHYGVKGMRWGVRRKATVGPQEVIISDRRKKIKTSGGEGHPAHPDAIRARVIGQKKKGSGIKSISDEELQAYTKRMNLEQNFNRLELNQRSAGRKFVANLLGQTGRTQVQSVADEAVSQQVKKHITSKINK